MRLSELRPLELCMMNVAGHFGRCFTGIDEFLGVRLVQVFLLLFFPVSFSSDAESNFVLSMCDLFHTFSTRSKVCRLPLSPRGSSRLPFLHFVRRQSPFFFCFPCNRSVVVVAPGWVAK